MTWNNGEEVSFHPTFIRYKPDLNRWWHHWLIIKSTCCIHPSSFWGPRQHLPGFFSRLLNICKMDELFQILVQFREEDAYKLVIAPLRGLKDKALKCSFLKKLRYSRTQLQLVWKHSVKKSRLKSNFNTSKSEFKRFFYHKAPCNFWTLNTYISRNIGNCTCILCQPSPSFVISKFHIIFFVRG